MSSTSIARTSRDIEDALAYLPRKAVEEFRRGQTVYNPESPPRGLYLVVKGRVKVTISMKDGLQTALGIFGRDEFFGESAMLGQAERHEWATTLDAATLMSWSAAEIEEQIERNSRLGMALIEML